MIAKLFDYLLQNKDSRGWVEEPTQDWILRQLKIENCAEKIQGDKRFYFVNTLMEKIKPVYEEFTFETDLHENGVNYLLNYIQSLSENEKTLFLKSMMEKIPHDILKTHFREQMIAARNWAIEWEEELEAH